ncbi:MAG: hypothetical protein ACOC1K_00755 [Nanoarchaeota archaeon]
MNYLLGKERTLQDLSHKEVDKLYHLQAGTKNLIDQGYSQSEVLSKLGAFGLNEKIAEIVYGNALEHKSLLADAQLINNIDSQLFSDFVAFIIDDYLLHGHYYYMSSDSFSDLDKFKDPGHAERILTVVRYKAMEVLRREILLPELWEQLVDHFELEEPKANIFVNLIDQNLDDLEKTFIVRTLLDIERELTKKNKEEVA